MPRSPRVAISDGIFHIASRGVAKEAIYRDDSDRRRFLDLLREVLTEHGWRCLSYCLMGNHYHLLIQLDEPNLSEGMQRLNGDYASAFNRRYERPGHLFEGRFWSKLVRRDAHLLWLARYIALNPVRARLSLAAERWRWSAHRALVGLEPPSFVDVAAMLSYFHSEPAQARVEYAALVADGEAEDARLAGVRIGEVLPAAERDQVIAHAYFALGHSVHEIAAAMGCHPDTVRRRLAAMSGRRGV